MIPEMVRGAPVNLSFYGKVKRIPVVDVKKEAALGPSGPWAAFLCSNMCQPASFDYAAARL